MQESTSGKQNTNSAVIIITTTESGLRLDRFVAALYPEQSRNVVAKAITGGAIRVNGTPKKPGYRIKTGEQVAITGDAFQHTPLLAGKALTAEPIVFPILYEDEHLLFLNKPPGLVVHPGSGNYSGTLVHGLLYHCAELAEVGDNLRPGIVHRLDKDTSGVMVVAKTAGVHQALTTMFAGHHLQKIYYALVCGNPLQEKDMKYGRIIGNIGRHHSNRQKMAVLERGGRFAASNWCFLEDCSSQKEGKYSLFEVDIETGRTHQIRVHLASIGYPVAGDLIYGGSRGRRNLDLFPRQMLHALCLSLVHPVTKKNLVIEAPLWEDFQNTLSHLRTIKKEQNG